MVLHRFHKDCTKTKILHQNYRAFLVHEIYHGASDRLLMLTSVRMDDTTFVPHVFPGKL